MSIKTKICTKCKRKVKENDILMGWCPDCNKEVLEKIEKLWGIDKMENEDIVEKALNRMMPPKVDIEQKMKELLQ